MTSLLSTRAGLGGMALALLTCLPAQNTAAQSPQPPRNASMPSSGLWKTTSGERAANAPYVRIAQLDVDPQRLADFNTVLQESVSTSVRVEPGVYTLYAVALKDTPNRFLVFEMYKDEATYNAHRETPHFRKFFEATQTMVTSRTFLDVEPVVLGAKAYWTSSGH